MSDGSAAANASASRRRGWRHASLRVGAMLVTVVIINFAVDVLYVVIDPRLRARARTT